MTTPQSGMVKAAIMKCIEEGMVDKREIYTKVVKDMGIPRPTVRRVAGVLRNELVAEINNLEKRLQEPES